MKKNLFNLLFLILATFIFGSNDSYSKNVPLSIGNHPSDLSQLKNDSTGFIRHILCQMDEIKYPMISPLERKSECLSSLKLEKILDQSSEANRSLSSIN